MPDDALRVHEEHRTRIDAALFIEDAVGLSDRAMRPVVREQGERNAAQLLGPGFQARKGVGADLQDLRIEDPEFAVVLTEPGDLVLSPAGECKR